MSEERSIDRLMVSLTQMTKLLFHSPLDIELAKAYTKELYERSFHPVGVAWNHIHAQENVGDLSQALKKVTAPGLFLHGEKDVLMRPEGGAKTAMCVLNAVFELIPKMGHMFFDRALQMRIASRLVRFFKIAR